MPQALRVERFRHKLKKFAEILFVEFLCRRELPEEGAEAGTEFGDAGIQEYFYRIRSLGKNAAVRRVTRSLQRKDKSLRRFSRPLSKRRWFLCAIKRSVDFDRSEMRARILEFLRMRQSFGIEHAAPRREGPAANTDVNPAYLFHSIQKKVSGRVAGRPDVVDPLYDFNVRGCRLRGRPWPSVSRFAVARNNRWAIPVLPNWPRMEELVRCSRLSRSSALYRIASRHRMAGDSFPQRMRRKPTRIRQR